MKLLLICLITLNTAFAESLTETLKKMKKNSKSRANPAVSKEFNRATQELRAKNLKTITKGKKIPNLTFTHPNNSSLSLASLYQNNPVILLFYRGHWCPYCMAELKAYQEMFKDFQKEKAIVLAVSPDKIIDIKKTKKKHQIKFILAQDPQNTNAKKIGLKFKVDSKVVELYKNYGIDISHTNNELPMPGTYIIDKKGIIQYSFVDPDYTVRADPQEVLQALKGLQSNHK